MYVFPKRTGTRSLRLGIQSKSLEGEPGEGPRGLVHGRSYERIFLLYDEILATSHAAGSCGEDKSMNLLVDHILPPFSRTLRWRTNIWFSSPM